MGQRAPRRPPSEPPPVPVAKPPDPQRLPGWGLYDRFCLACHGVRGDGAGPATPWLDPPPRDFTAGWFKWGGTGDAQAPAPSAIAEVIRWGAPGTAMHGFGASLDDAQIDQLVEVVRAFAGHAPDGLDPLARGRYGVKIFLGAEKRAQLERGKALYGTLGCPQCHGPAGRGDGPSAAGLKNAAGADNPPYDLTASPVRRPREDDSLQEREAAILDAIAHGVGGTAMPGFHGSAPLDDLMAVAAYIAAIGPAVPASAAGPFPGGPLGLTPGDIGDLSPASIARDRTGRLATAGHRVSHAGDPDGVIFGGDVPLQSGPDAQLPAALGPVQAWLSSRQCGRCHAKQVREWTGSVHAAASSPGLIGQIIRFKDPAEVRSCLRCHAPLAEQQETADKDAALQAEGLTCAACHVRGGVRHGPAVRAPSLLALPGYPLQELAVYERADFCIGCHQLPPRLAVAGRPLLDTYREWLLGPYMKRGIQCQHCHMPNREHTWKGVHDPETFRQGFDIAASARRLDGGIVSVRARMTNVGAGHYLPTTPTPAAWLELELLDQAGAVIPGTAASKRIGRELRFARGRFEEVEDTRIPPGQSLSLDKGWRGGRIGEATHLRVRVRVKPDDYYEGLYRRRLRARLDGVVRGLFDQALARAVGSEYVAYEEVFKVE